MTSPDTPDATDVLSCLVDAHDDVVGSGYTYMCDAKLFSTLPLSILDLQQRNMIE
jgi:hypothetical protein